MPNLPNNLFNNRDVAQKIEFLHFIVVDHRETAGGCELNPHRPFLKEITMQKFYAIGFHRNADNDWYWSDNSCKRYKTYEEAELMAKKKVSKDKCGDDFFIMESVAKVQAPVPEAIVTKL
jgi:hypothetical protein